MPVVATMDVPQIMDLRLAAIGGDLPVDGSIGRAHRGRSRRPTWTAGGGAAYYEDEELERFFLSGHAAGLQVGVHAIGDRAIEQVLSAWERVYATLDSRGRRHFRARRHRIEHFEMVSDVAGGARRDARARGLRAAGVRRARGAGPAVCTSRDSARSGPAR